MNHKNTNKFYIYIFYLQLNLKMKKNPVGCGGEAGRGEVGAGGRGGSVFSTEPGEQDPGRVSLRKGKEMERPILLHPGCRPTVWTDEGLVHWRL